MPARAVRLRSLDTEFASRLHQLDSVAERVEDVATREARNLVVPCRVKFTALDEAREILNRQRRVRLAGSDKRFLHADVQPYISSFEPRATSLCEQRRFRHLGQTQHADIEVSGVVFSSVGDGELNVVDADPFRCNWTSAGPPKRLWSALPNS